jgi:hypothetical protein
MSEPPPPPQISPDGKFYWDGQAWQPMPAGPAPQISEGKVLSSLPGIKLTLYPNRLEVEQGVLLTKKRETILLKAITDVSVPTLRNELRITTSDGKKRSFACSHAKAAKEAIVTNL